MGEIQIPDEGEFGAGLPFLEKLQLLAEWMPLLSRLQAVANAASAEDRAAAIVKALQWAAGKSPTTLDDEALFHLEAVLRSPEGKAFFDWVVKQVSG